MVKMRKRNIILRSQIDRKKIVFNVIFKGKREVDLGGWVVCCVGVLEGWESVKDFIVYMDFKNLS